MFKKLDKNDYEILRIMVKHGTTNSEKISTLTSISSKTIRNRIIKYKQHNIFRSAILINPDVFSYNIKADFFIKKKRNVKIDEIIKLLMKKYKHNLMYIGHHWAGEEDISIQTIFQSTDEIVTFKKEMDSNNLIDKYKMIIVPIVVRDTYEWMPHQDNFKLSDKDIQSILERRKKENSIF